jgi:hypothetical protein
MGREAGLLRKRMMAATIGTMAMWVRKSASRSLSPVVRTE